MKSKLIIKTGIACSLLMFSVISYSAIPVDLRHQSSSKLRAILSPIVIGASDQLDGLTEISRDVDFNHNLHIRLQQMHAGFPVIGADFNVHIREEKKNSSHKDLNALLTTSNAKMNGIVYQNLSTDLRISPAVLAKDEHTSRAFSHILKLYQQSGTKKVVADKKIKLMIYVDKNNIAHWVYLASFQVTAPNTLPEIPTYIIDASTLHVYKKWNDAQTMEIAQGGGFGGNKKTGMTSYDGIADHLPGFNISRDLSSNTCYLRDDVAVVRDARKDYDVVNFSCPAKVKQHNNLYWNGGLGNDPDIEEFTNPDAANGGYSPSNDAYYAAHVVKGMYKDWYNIEPVVDYYTKQPLKIVMFTHACHFLNAVWSMDHMVLCDGDDGAYNTDYASYPVTSLDVIAHEISHGFTFNHSLLRYDEQSGGINESFSDMAAQAISYYTNGHTDWLIGATLFKNNDRALRYMNNPTQDCKNGDQPGISCSIDHVKDYTDKTDVHHSSGVFNKAFYLMSTASNWNVRKAFNIMVHANRYYWTYDATFASAACGVIDATKDYGYDTDAVTNAFSVVGIDTSNC